MNRKNKSPSLEEQYLEIFTGTPEIGEDAPSLEQPYAGRILPTVTTYSITDKPEILPAD